MILDFVTKDTTDYSCMVRVVDSTDGTPETSVAYNTAGVDLWYRRAGGTHVSITEATQTENGAHTDGGFVHVSDGYCRLDLPDAAVATGVDYVDVGGTFTDMIVIGGRIRLTDLDLSDGVRGGLTSLPNAAADAAGGLPISDAGGLDLDTLDSNVSAVLTDTGTTIPALIGTPSVDLAADIAAIAADQKPKKNAALSNIGIYLVSSTDHVTPVTGISPTVEIAQDGGAFAAMDGSSAIAEVSDGLYQLDLVAGDMNADVVIIKVTGTGADPALLSISTVD